jgi:hypothetical protein
VIQLTLSGGIIILTLGKWFNVLKTILKMTSTLITANKKSYRWMSCLFVRSRSSLFIFAPCFSSTSSPFCHTTSSSLLCCVFTACAGLTSFDNFLLIGSLRTAVGSCSFILAGDIASFSSYSFRGSFFFSVLLPAAPSSYCLSCSLELVLYYTASLFNYSPRVLFYGLRQIFVEK